MCAKATKQKSKSEKENNNTSSDDFTDRLGNLVEAIKQNEKFKGKYAAMNLHDHDIRKEAKAEGKHENAVSTATNLLKMNVLTPEQIAQAAGLALEEVLSLQKKISESVC